MRALQVLLVLQTLLALQVAHAQPKLPYSPSPIEVAMLPQVCQAYFTGPAGRASVAPQIQGIDGFHHFCYGMNFLNRSRLTTDKVEKRFNLQSAAGEFGYVLTKSSPNAPFLVQVRQMKGLVDLQLKSLR